MYLAWTTAHRPFMTPDAWAMLDQLARSRAILNFVPTSQLFAQFPQLHLGDTADFNHFWLYSLLAAIVGKASALFASPVSPHDAFLLLHSLLFGFLLALAYLINRWSGLTAVTVLTVLSPLVWYVDKVHTEFFTYCMVCGAVIALCGHRYFLSSVLLAIASTQNVSFAAIAALPLVFALFDGGIHQRFTLGQLISAAAVALLVLLHPAYYFFRYGAIDPQLIAGGASIGGNLRNFYVWLLDLDIGLFPNWPLGVLLIVALIVSLARKLFGRDNMSQASARKRIHWREYLIFCACYLIVNLFAQSSTEKLNSGATPGLARYATWYIPLFYPALRTLLRNVQRIKLSTVSGAAKLICLVPGLAICIGYTYAFQRPELSEGGYVQPSPASRFVQTHWPGTYDPPEEIFAKRYSGVGEAPELATALAVVGPDCRKVLVEKGAGRIFGLAGCGLDEKRMSALLRSGTLSEVPRGDYVELSDKQAEALLLPCPDVIILSDRSNAIDEMLRGFSAAEPWGRWSDGTHASIVCASRGIGKAVITAHGFTTPGRVQRWSVAANEGPRLSFQFDASTREVEAPIAAEKGKQMKLTFWFPDVISPQSLGLSEDQRQLALGLTTVRFTP
ncbi:hypothetical protein LJR230_000911 [Trinickia sp. LjRoot230]|uniref:hypothetical protein n=1 Tax=Trinickia sp. LjRoot230 TaxID=3342288 RepID=UPI003ECE2C87